MQGLRALKAGVRGAHRAPGRRRDHTRPTLGDGLWCPLLAIVRIANRQARRGRAPATCPCTPKAGGGPPGVPGSLPGGRPQDAWAQRLVMPFRVGDGGSRGLFPAGLGFRSPDDSQLCWAMLGHVCRAQPGRVKGSWGCLVPSGQYQDLTTTEPSSWERKVLPPAPGLERSVLVPMPGQDSTDKELKRKRGELGIHPPIRKHSPRWARTASPPAWLRPSLSKPEHPSPLPPGSRGSLCWPRGAHARPGGQRAAPAHPLSPPARRCHQLDGLDFGDPASRLG